MASVRVKANGYIEEIPLNLEEEEEEGKFWALKTVTMPPPPWCAAGTLLIQCRLHKTKKHMVHRMLDTLRTGAVRAWRRCRAREQSKGREARVFGWW